MITETFEKIFGHIEDISIKFNNNNKLFNLRVEFRDRKDNPTVIEKELTLLELFDVFEFAKKEDEIDIFYLFMSGKDGITLLNLFEFYNMIKHSSIKYPITLSIHDIPEDIGKHFVDVIKKTLKPKSDSYIIDVKFDNGIITFCYKLDESGFVLGTWLVIKFKIIRDVVRKVN